MISKITVTARAASMEEAEREIEVLMAHARMAGYLEGIVPQSVRGTDEHFGQAPGAERHPEAWRELGLPYEGRKSYSFEAELVRGGLKEYGFTVLQHPEGEQFTNDPPSLTDGEDITDRVIVLNRHYPATRDTTLESPGDPTGLLNVQKEPSPENMARVVALVAREIVQSFGFTPQRGGWGIDISVHVPFGEHAMGQTTGFHGATLSEALDKAEEFVDSFAETATFGIGPTAAQELGETV